jgi:hypothetical protein
MARAQLANCRVILGRFSNYRLCFALPRLQSQADATAVLGDELQASALELPAPSAVTPVGRPPLPAIIGDQFDRNEP